METNDSVVPSQTAEANNSVVSTETEATGSVVHTETTEANRTAPVPFFDTNFWKMDLFYDLVDQGRFRVDEANQIFYIDPDTSAENPVTIAHIHSALRNFFDKLRIEDGREPSSINGLETKDWKFLEAMFRVWCGDYRVDVAPVVQLQWGLGMS